MHNKQRDEMIRFVGNKNPKKSIWNGKEERVFVDKFGTENTIQGSKYICRYQECVFLEGKPEGRRNRGSQRLRSLE